MAVVFLEPGSDATADVASFYRRGTLGSGTITSVTDFAFTGPRSIKSVAAAANDQGVFQTPDNIVADAGTAFMARVRLSSVAPSVATALLAVMNAGGSSALRVGLDTTGKLRIDGRDATSKLGTTALSANTWYRISGSYKITSSTNWTFNVYLDGTLEATTSNVDGTLGAVATTNLISGINAYGGVGSPWSNTSILTAWFDDIYVDNRTDLTSPGDVQATAKRPNANGTTNGYTTQIGTGGSGYGAGRSPQVNEQPLSQTNGWSMVGAGSAVTEEYNVEGPTVGDVNIGGATVVDTMGWVFSKALAAETGQIVVNGVSSNIALTATPTMFIKMTGSTTHPAGTGADIGEITSTDLTTVSLYECGVIVGYTAGGRHGRLLGQARNRRIQQGW